MEEYNQHPRKYHWPDWRVQTFFKKVVSSNWQKKISEEYDYDDETLLKKFKKIVKDEGSGGVRLFRIKFCNRKSRVVTYLCSVISWA